MVFRYCHCLCVAIGFRVCFRSATAKYGSILKRGDPNIDPKTVLIIGARKMVPLVLGTLNPHPETILNPIYPYINLYIPYKTPLNVPAVFKKSSGKGQPHVALGKGSEGLRLQQTHNMYNKWLLRRPQCQHTRNKLVTPAYTSL